MLVITSALSAYTPVPRFSTPVMHHVEGVDHMPTSGLYCEDEYDPLTKTVDEVCVPPPYTAGIEDMSGCVLLGDYPAPGAGTRWACQERKGANSEQEMTAVPVGVSGETMKMLSYVHYIRSEWPEQDAKDATQMMWRDIAPSDAVVALFEAQVNDEVEAARAKDARLFSRLKAALPTRPAPSGLWCEDEYDPLTKTVEEVCVPPPYMASIEDMSGCVLLGDYPAPGAGTRWACQEKKGANCEEELTAVPVGVSGETEKMLSYVHYIREARTADDVAAPTAKEKDVRLFSRLKAALPKLTFRQLLTPF
jgi:hypothetical protein